MISKMFGKEDDFVWAEVFFKEDFTVDRFLSKNTNKSDLVSLRQGLKKYGSELHKCMSEILKNETEAIVNLAEALSNLTSKIDDLSKPASQLQEEIRGLYEAIKSMKQSFDEQTKKTKTINDKREFLNVNNKVISTCISVENIIDNNFRNGTVDLLLLDRAVNEYSFQKTYSQEKGLNTLQNECVMIIERKLNAAVDETFINGVLRNDDKVIERCLRMYVNLKRQQDAELIYKEKFVRLPLSEIFNKKNFENNSQQLNRLYDQALQFLHCNMNVIINIITRNQDLKGFNFIINSFWEETDNLIRHNLQNITAPGNPELFQRRFKDTWQFLKVIAAKCGNSGLLLEEDSFQEHIKRFNLPVYFEIRFQQIAGKLERKIISNSTINNEFKNNADIFNLKVTSMFWSCFTECFREDVFIDHLTGQFFKLSMLLLSRYMKWLENILDKIPSNELLEKLEKFIVLSLVDLETLKSKIAFQCSDVNLLKDSIFKIVCSDIQPLVLDVMKSYKSAIDNITAKFHENLIQLKLQESMDKLQDVASVPRLYRRTNRSVPVEPSSYILSAVDPIVRFSGCYESYLKDQLKIITDKLILKMTENYLSLVHEVLHSVGKTEKSLRRLKNRSLNINEEAAGQTTSDLNSDEGKIREQIRLDVDYFVVKLSPFTMASGNKAMEELKSIL